MLYFLHMSLTQTIKSEMVAAMKAKDALKLSVIRSAMTAFTNELVAKGKKPTDPLDDAEAIAVLKRLAKQRQDSAEQFTKGNRPELAEKEEKELAILKAYLPETASKEAIEAVAKEKIASMGSDKAKIGMLVGAVMKEFKGTADGNDVKAVIESLLG